MFKIRDMHHLVQNNMVSHSGKGVHIGKGTRYGPVLPDIKGQVVSLDINWTFKIVDLEYPSP